MASRRSASSSKLAAPIKAAAVIPQPITEELDTSFLDYAMSVIVSRALPDVRDGLKPVHRRILVTLHDESLTPGRPYKKSAAVVGSALAKYHPHGDSSVYDAMVRLAQPHVMNAPLIDGQGNWGCLSGDTRVRLADGTTPTIAEMAAAGPEQTFWVYAVDETGRIVMAEAKAARQTKASASLVEVELDSNTVVRATPDHLFMLRSGEWRPAADLQPGDSLMPGYFRLTEMARGEQQYEQIQQPRDGTWEWTHQIAMESNRGRLNSPLFDKMEESRPAQQVFGLSKRLGDRVRLGWLSHYHLQLGPMAQTLWSDLTYRTNLSKALRGIEQLPLSEAQAARVGSIIGEAVTAASLRQALVQSIVGMLRDERVRQHLCDELRHLWLDAGHRARFSKASLKREASGLWLQAGARDQHRTALLREWDNPDFRTDHWRRGQLAERAGQVGDGRAATLGHLNRMAKMSNGLPARVTKEWFEANRPRRGVPSFRKAIAYFRGDVGTMRASAVTYNHQVTAVRACAAQEAVFDLTVPLHENFLLASGVFVHNSADGDAAAAYRYTEARMAQAAAALLADIDKDTVEWKPTFDARHLEPTVLPAGLPNLLLNGNEGIAVGMATKIPPHNLKELVAAVSVLCDNPEAEDQAVLSKIKGPDFPTGGLMVQGPEIKSWLRTGRGRFVLRAKAQVETSNTGRAQIVVTEVPYGVSPADALNKIAGVYREGRGLAALGGARLQDVLATTRNETSREGLRLVFELKKGADPAQVLQALYKVSDLQLAYSAQLLTLVGGMPRTIGVREALQHYLTHRISVIVRRTKHDLAKAEARLHIVEGLLVAIDAIDTVVRLIRGAASRDVAKASLMKRLKLTEIQTDAILAMRLAQLTALDVTELRQEAAALTKTIAQYRKLLASESQQRSLVKAELEQAAAPFASARRTEIIKVDLDAEQEAVAAMPASVAVKGKAGASEGESRPALAGLATAAETVSLLPTGQLAIGERKPKGLTHQQIVRGTTPVWALTSKARAIAVTTAQLAPHTGVTRPLSAALVLPSLERDERVLALETPLATGESLVFVYTNGMVKRITGDQIGTVRPVGTSLAMPQADDVVLTVLRVTESAEILLVSAEGQALRTPVEKIPAQGRASRGVAGMRLDGGEADRVVSASVVTGAKQEQITVVTARGLARRTPGSEFPAKGRGTGGVRIVEVTPKTGPVVYAGPVENTRWLIEGGQGTITIDPSKEAVAGGRAVTPKPLEGAAGEVRSVRVVAP